MLRHRPGGWRAPRTAPAPPTLPPTIAIFQASAQPALGVNGRGTIAQTALPVMQQGALLGYDRTPPAEPTTRGIRRIPLPLSEEKAHEQRHQASPARPGPVARRRVRQHGVQIGR